MSSNNTIWHNNRRFSLRQLRDLGMGKSKLVDAVQRQAAWLAEVLSKQTDEAAPVPHALKVAIINVLWQLVGGEFIVVTHFSSALCMYSGSGIEPPVALTSHSPYLPHKYLLLTPVSVACTTIKKSTPGSKQTNNKYNTYRDSTSPYTRKHSSWIKYEFRHNTSIKHRKSPQSRPVL